MSGGFSGVDHAKSLGEPEYIDKQIFYDDEADNSIPDGLIDSLFDKAVKFVTEQGKASTSFIQRQFKIGYNRAARLMEKMEKREIVGPARGAASREVLLKNENLREPEPNPAVIPITMLPENQKNPEADKNLAEEAWRHILK